MMNKLTYPFRLAIKELKKDNAFRKTIQSKTIRSTLLGFMGQSCIFLLIMFILYIVLIYIVVVTFLDPLSFIAFPFMFLLLYFFILIFKNAIAKSKENFLKNKNVYEQYKEVTKELEYRRKE